MLFSILC
ncbi:uncharacterized protein FTOL_13569 [Fusarium torulosum]|nr:uncharacterized protein FTOL_13569 [Fusarium torulosum]